MVGLDFDVVLFGEGFRVLICAVFAGEVGDCHGGAHFGAAAGCFEADAAGVGGAGYHDDLPF